MKKDAPMDTLDPARTALVVVHMVKGVAGEVDTPFNRIFRPRAEKTGIIGVQARLLDGFRTGKAKSNAKVVYTAVTYQPGYPGVMRNSRLFRTLIDNGPSLLLEGTPAVEVIGDLAPRPGEPVVRGQGANGFDRTELDSILRQAGVDTLVLVGIATDVAVESTARAACDLGYRTIVVSDACTADSDEAHARALDVHRAWFGETATADEVLSALGGERTNPGKSAEATRTAA
ncbi:MAG TPA: isochorismatase family cysteine hydrolase [Candidatus Acidoferrales bacterium]|jgi:nicotinamidase-related amidase|nr:isochorismatase family cysteine hydrolase [Candidatus Acidoferrales bacterium]